VHFTATSTEDFGTSTSTAPTETTASITVNGTADTPVVTANTSAGSTTENVATLLSGLKVSTADASDNDKADFFTAKLYVEHGKLSAGTGPFTVGGGDGHDSANALTISGLLTDVNTALAAVSYPPHSEFEGTDHVHFTATSTEDFGTSTSTAPPE